MKWPSVLISLALLLAACAPATESPAAMADAVYRAGADGVLPNGGVRVDVREACNGEPGRARAAAGAARAALPAGQLAWVGCCLASEPRRAPPSAST